MRQNYTVEMLKRSRAKVNNELTGILTENIAILNEYHRKERKNRKLEAKARGPRQRSRRHNPNLVS